MADGFRLRGFCTLLRNLFFAAVIYTFLFGTFSLIRNPSLAAKGKIGIPAVLGKAGPAEFIQKSKGSVKVKFASSSKTITINPHANVFNRPTSAVKAKDDYLGPRPHVDTEADLQLLVEECRGSYLGIEKVNYVFKCLEFLANDEKRYYSLPGDGKRASQQDPRKAEYVDADGHGNSLTKYLSLSDAKPADKKSIGTCPGPIIPYHVYWTGPATWRVEIFVKSYLYTQNLACSRLWIWLDSDRNPNAVKDMMEKDALFARFLPLLDQGHITLKEWRFPQRIPLPKEEDNTDGLGYYKTPGSRNAQGERPIADGIIEDKNGQQWLVLTPRQMTFLPVAVSDAMRFVVLHIHGGLYFDMDVLMLRDMRPLALPKAHSFAERWGAHSQPGDYNTAIMSLTANSSLSSYLLRGGVRMGLNFHPLVIGRMAWKDGRDQEFLKLETGAVDPLWTEFNGNRQGRCTVPCFRDYSAAFKGKTGALFDEWESYDGPQLPLIDLTKSHHVREGEMKRETPAASSGTQKHTGEATDSFRATSAEEEELRKAGIIAEYNPIEDKYLPNNRTLENFYRGTWTYHIHNQWRKHPEPSSWLSVIENAHDGFFAGQRTNMYGEKWHGLPMMPYNFWPEFV